MSNLLHLKSTRLHSGHLDRSFQLIRYPIKVKDEHKNSSPRRLASREELIEMGE